MVLSLPLLLTLSAASPTVAVLYFDYTGQSEQLGVLKKGLAQMMITDLAGSDRYQIVERDRLEDVLRELDLAKSGRLDRRAHARIGKLLGARFLVVGGYFDLGDTLRVDARLVRVETGEVVASVGEGGSVQTFGALQGRLAEALGAAIEAALPKAKTSPPRGASPPKKTPRDAAKKPAELALSTALHYGRALEARDRADRPAEKKALEAALAEQPAFSLAKVDLMKLVQ